MKRRHLLAAAGLVGAAGLGLTTGTTPAHASSRKALNWTTHEIQLIDPSYGGSSLDDVDSAAGGTWAVGARLLDGYQVTAPLIVRWDGRRFVETPTKLGLGQLHGVAVVSRTEVWAVGVEESGDDASTLPLVLRWNGRAWRKVAAPAVPAGAFDTVDVGPDGAVWVSGWARIGSTEHGVVYRRHGDSWTMISKGLADTINGNALLVRTASDALLAANPGLDHFDGQQWSPMAGFPDDGSSILTGLAAAGQQTWGVGVAHTGGIDGEQSLVVRGNGKVWSPVTVPPRSSQLSDVAIWRGRAIAVGERFQEQDSFVRSYPYVLGQTLDRFLPTDAPRSLTEPADAEGTLTGITAGTTRLWTVGTVNEGALAASCR